VSATNIVRFHIRLRYPSHLDIANGVSLEKVDKFCYLGDMLDADGGCDSAGLSQKDAQSRNKWRGRIKGAAG